MLSAFVELSFHLQGKRRKKGISMYKLKMNR